MLKEFRSPFIFYCDLSNHKEIKETYYPHIKDIFEESKDTKVETWNCEVLTTFNFNVQFFYDDLFQNSVIWQPLDRMLEEVNLCQYPLNSWIHGIWANYYDKGAFQEVHDHVGVNRTHFSGIYIMDQTGENKTSFINNNFGILDQQLHTKDIDDIKEGSVILFPSNLLHYVNPVDDPRCTISFNIMCEF